MSLETDIVGLSAKLGNVLHQRGWWLVTAESCTGGGIASAITEIAGSSNWFDRSFVTYSNEAKQQMLGVSRETLARCGAVSQEVVIEMAYGALKHSSADIAVAVSGIAGPGGGSKDKPVGTIWFAWVERDGQALARRVHLEGDRHSIRQQAVRQGLLGLLAMSAPTDRR